MCAHSEVGVVCVHSRGREMWYAVCLEAYCQRKVKAASRTEALKSLSLNQSQWVRRAGPAPSPLHTEVWVRSEETLNNRRGVA